MRRRLCDRQQKHEGSEPAGDARTAAGRSSDPGPGEPPRLHRLGSSAFVGRQGEMAELRAGLGDALQGRGRLVLLVGEPGVGKSRTADELAAEASERGAEVLVGRCYEGKGAPAYWPWVQVVRAFMSSRTPAALMAEMGPYAADIAQVVPALRERLPALRTPPHLEPEQARFRLFDSVTTFLKTAAHRRPLTLILDDLHCADTASLLLLAFLGRELADARLLVVGTYRDTEVRRSDPLAETLAELARQRSCFRVPLAGLTEADVARFIALTVGSQPSAVVAAVYRKTEGNPLFVTEVVRLLVTEGRLTSPGAALVSGRIVIPQGVREVIGRRLNRLSAECNHVLTLAAVIGRDFELSLLERVSRLPRDRLLVLVEEAATSRIVAEIAGAAGRYRFAHVLIRETLYDELSTRQRVLLHGQVGAALETVYAHRLEAHLDELAHHFLQSAAGGEADRAIEWAMKAARRAAALLAHEEAARHCEHALQALEVSAAVDDHRRCDVLLALGDAQARAGDVAKARRSFARAADLARTLGAPGALARAALGFSGPVSEIGVLDPAAAGLLDEALAGLPEGDSPLRARVLGRLAMELTDLEAHERPAELTEEAVSMSRRIGDVQTLAYALTARQGVRWDTEHLEGRLADADELVGRAEAEGQSEISLLARCWRIRDLLQRGDVAAADAEIESCARLATAVRHPLHLHRNTVHQAMRALMSARFSEARRLGAEFAVSGQRVWPDNAILALASQSATLHRMQGPLEPLEPQLRALAERFPTMLVFRIGLAIAHTELGADTEARAEFERLAAKDFTDVPGNHLWVPTMVLLAELCAALRDGVRAAALHHRLLPYAARYVVVGLSDCYGAAARYLGQLATAMRCWDVAAGHFEAALEMNARINARPYVALTQRDYAVMLLERDRRGDRAAARALLARAIEIARALGMTREEARLVGLAAAADVNSPSEGASASAGGCAVRPAPQTRLFRRDGEFWTIGREAAAFRLKDSIGLRCLAQLLRHPRREFLALDLACTVRHGADNGRPHADDSGELLDRGAAAAYRQRLRELAARREEIAGLGDAARIAEIDVETAFLAAELARGVGLSGRRRRSSAAERARVNVTRTVGAALRRVAAHDATLGRELATSVKTGMFCSYQPRPDVRVSWML